METVGENLEGMKRDAIEMMNTHYRAADLEAKRNRLEKARQHLEAAEIWRVLARSHGANV